MPEEKHPTSGGRWMRDPETGALTQVQEPTAWDAAETPAEETAATETPAPAPVKKGK